MASITVTITGAASGPYAGGITRDITISDDDSDRLLAYATGAFRNGGSGLVRSDAEAIDAFITSLATHVMNQVVNSEREQAARTARDAVSDVPFSVG